MEKNDGFLINEQLRLMGPLSVQDPLHVSYDNEKIMKFSKDNGINEGNLQKIIGLFLKNPKAGAYLFSPGRVAQHHSEKLQPHYPEALPNWSFDADTHRGLYGKRPPR